MRVKILLVEDEIKLANATRRALELQKYIVDVAYDGDKGLDLALGEKYDLMILDLMLPEIDGLEICKTVREEKITTPILMLTAKGQVSDKVIGLDAGADDYMVKPFSFEELFARVRALSRRTVKNKDQVLKVKNLTLDTNTSKVKMNNSPIELSPREFAILEYLMRNKNIVVSKPQIINNVWNYETDILPTTIEVHIKHLRDKIDGVFGTDLIRTVRGFGYELNDEE